jgi:hypothetical protein
MAGTSPSIFAKSIVASLLLTCSLRLVRLNAKSPPLLGIGGLLDLISGCCLFSGGVRRHVRHVVMMGMAMVAVNGHTP